MRYTASSNLNMSLLDSRDQTANKIGELPFGHFAKGDEVFSHPSGDIWLHVLDLDGTVVDGWMKIIYLGHAYCTLIDTLNALYPPPPANTVTRVKYTITVAQDDAGNLYSTRCDNKDFV
jgi:hypothetical protein